MDLDEETIEILARMCSLAGTSGLQHETLIFTEFFKEFAADNESAKLLRAASLAGIQDYDSARAILLDELLADDPNHPMANAYLAMIYTFTGDTFQRNLAMEKAKASEDADAIEFVENLNTAA